mgnify:CR=1 FL=1
MTVNVDNIIVGSGNLYISVLGDSYYATFDSIAQGTLDTNGSHVGATMDGAEVQYEPNYTDIEIDQFKDAAIIFNNGFKVTVRTNLAEGTQTNLINAWGLPASSLQPVGGGVRRLNLPVAPDDPTERRLIIFGKSPAATSTVLKRRKYYCRRAISVDTSSHALKRGEATMFPISFRILADPNYSNAEYGYIEDEQQEDELKINTTNPLVTGGLFFVLYGRRKE